MNSVQITIAHEVGLHARPAALFVQTAQKYEAAITIDANEKTANAKSMLGILMLGVTQGTEIVVSADGPDEEEAISALKSLIENNFGE
jgi:phosphotransferase system HPr (HPr) family protein